MTFSKLRFRRLIAPALLVLAIGCNNYDTYSYVPYPSADLRTCDQPCGDRVTVCRIVARCVADAVGDPEACQMAAQELRDGEVIIECAVEHQADTHDGDV